MWKQLRSELLYGSRWYGAQRGWLRMDKILSHTDTSSRTWAGVYSSPDSILRISEDFSQDDVRRHINEKEAIALYKFLWNLLQKDPLLFERKNIHIQVDNEVLNRIYNQGGSNRQLFITDFCKRLFWLQVQYKFQLEVSWVATISNQADAMTREDIEGDLKLCSTCFHLLWSCWGPFKMDLMSSSANIQVDPSGRSLPFYSRYYIATARNTDVFAQHIGRDPILNSEAPLNYCFPPYALLLTFLNHLKMCKGRCVVIMPKKEGSSEWSLASIALDILLF